MGFTKGNKRDHPPVQGEKCAAAILTTEDVIEIKKERQERPTDRQLANELADRFGVKPRAIQLIWSGKNWKHIQLPTANS